MRYFIGVLVLASLIACLAAPQKKPVKKPSDAPGYQGVRDGTREATGKTRRRRGWVRGERLRCESSPGVPREEAIFVHRDDSDWAVFQLKSAHKVELKFNITDIKNTATEVSEKVKFWSSHEQTHAPTSLNYLKEKVMNTRIPNIICVLTGNTMYGETYQKEPGVSPYKGLCKTTVPMLLTYNANNLTGTGNVLYQLILNSTNLKSTDEPRKWNSYFSKCGKRDKKKTEKKQKGKKQKTLGEN